MLEGEILDETDAVKVGKTIQVEDIVKGLGQRDAGLFLAPLLGRFRERVSVADLVEVHGAERVERVLTVVLGAKATRGPTLPRATKAQLEAAKLVLSGAIPRGVPGNLYGPGLRRYLLHDGRSRNRAIEWLDEAISVADDDPDGALPAGRSKRKREPKDYTPEEREKLRQRAAQAREVRMGNIARRREEERQRHQQASEQREAMV